MFSAKIGIVDFDTAFQRMPVFTAGHGFHPDHIILTEQDLCPVIFPEVPEAPIFHPLGSRQVFSCPSDSLLFHLPFPWLFCVPDNEILLS